MISSYYNLIIRINCNWYNINHLNISVLSGMCWQRLSIMAALKNALFFQQTFAIQRRISTRCTTKSRHCLLQHSNISTLRSVSFGVSILMSKYLPLSIVCFYSRKCWWTCSITYFTYKDDEMNLNAFNETCWKFVLVIIHLLFFILAYFYTRQTKHISIF